MAEASADAVLFDELPARGGYRIGVAMLNAEASLNALTLGMIRRLDLRLQRWATDPQVACVVLCGAGDRAFCAGGDVRFLRDAILEHPGAIPNPVAEAFFSEEYRLDHRIHTYPKPTLLWGNGIVMGGGLGFMAGASHRVVTETSRIAMPEITIGLFPDVGGSWFLQRMAGRVGLFLALTGAALNGHDALVVGLADHFLRSVDRDAVLVALCEADWSHAAGSNRTELARTLSSFAESARALLPEANVVRHRSLIDQLVAGDELGPAVARITSYAGDDPWLRKAARALQAGSPTSAALIWALWHRARHLGLAGVFRLELVVALQCCAHPDFAEGVRALLIDKDNHPGWTPSSLADVTSTWIDEHFAPPWSVWQNQANPLADLG